MAENTEEIVKKQIRYLEDNGRNRTFYQFGITDKDIGLGLRHVKAKVRYVFKKLAKQHHPDTSKRNLKCALTFKDLIKSRDRILAMTIMPITLDNLEIILDIKKGYKSTIDMFLPWD